MLNNELLKDDFISEFREIELACISLWLLNNLKICFRKNIFFRLTKIEFGLTK